MDYAWRYFSLFLLTTTMQSSTSATVRAMLGARSRLLFVLQSQSGSAASN